MNIGQKNTKGDPTVKQQQYSKRSTHPTSLEEIVEKAKNASPVRSLLSEEILTDNQTLKSVLPSEEEGVSFNHFMDIASSFWSRKFEEKAQELQKKGKKEPLFLNLGSLNNFNMGIPQDSDLMMLNSSGQMASVSHSQSVRIPENLESINIVSEIEPKNSIELLSESEDKNPQDIQWNSAQDEVLLNLAYELKCDWKAISKQFAENKITPKALRSRYNYLKSITLPNKARFSSEEDAKVLKYYEIYGTNWRVIAHMFPGRTATTIKNRFYSALRDKIKASSDSNVPMKVRRTQTVPSKLTFFELGSKALGGTEMAIEDNIMRKSKEIGTKPRSMIDTYEKRSAEFTFECDRFFAFDSTFPYRGGEHQDEVILPPNNNSENIHNYPLDERNPFYSYNQGFSDENQPFRALMSSREPGQYQEEEEKKEMIPIERRQDNIVLEEEEMENSRQEDLDPLNQASNQFASLFFDFPEKIDKGPYGKWG